MELNTPPPVPAEHPLCRTWGQGALITRKTFRMSGPVLVIGFILLIPSVLGMLFGILVLVLTSAGGTQTSASSARDIRARLVAQEVPESVIAEVVASKPVENPELVSLTSQQRSAVHDAQLSASAQKVGGGVAQVVAGGFSLIVIGMSFLGVCIGWRII